jgi:hypothetical protein
MKRIRLFVAAFAVFVGLGAAVVAPAYVSATPKSTVCTALGSNDSCTKDTGNGVSLSSVVKVIVNILSLIVGIVAVIMIIVGGFRYVTSGGDSNNITSAKNTILYAIVGLVVVALAQFIVQFVVAKVTAPTCTSTQVLNDKTNKCVTKKKAGLAGGQLYAIVDRHLS